MNKELIWDLFGLVLYELGITKLHLNLYSIVFNIQSNKMLPIVPIVFTKKFLKKRVLAFCINFLILIYIITII